ncbi:MAG: nitroreductase [Actinomycetota bacterium]|nr:nitroreductase [Actinomycetota bacterium]MDD5667985.1 nitroreductase [Actinomycetota bacterium]
MTDVMEVEENAKASPAAVDMYEWREGMPWNPVERVILERRSVRKYKDKQVPERLVRRILEAGRFAPTAGNSQSWKFVVVRDRDMIDAMQKYVQLRCKVFKFFLNWQKSPLGKLAWFYTQLSARVMPNLLHPIPFGAISLIAEGKLKLFHDAPTVILVLVDRRGAAKPLVDVGICGQNMVLAAHSLGLGTCWVGFVEVFKFGTRWKKKLGVGWPYELIEGIALGYPVGNPDGMIERELQEIEWWEDGRKRTVF